ncbi:MAG: DUF1576 domain-containing protein [Erysipelotrichia bacterium]|nr:DUF1576 domain-containing protein [Erysipelotrichia bacterium]
MYIMSLQASNQRFSTRPMKPPPPVKPGLSILKNKRFLVMTLYMVALILLGLLWPRKIPLSEQYYRILTSPGILISDFFAVGGVSAALINAGIVGLMAIIIIYKTRTILSGPTIAAIFTLAGFAMFGKTPLNIWPIPFGVAISAWLRKENFRSFILVALFGTALGPIVSQVTFGLGMSYLSGIVIGLMCGIVLPGLASHLLHNHQGFCLYNTGFTCGIIGMFAASMLKMTGHNTEMAINWYTGSQTELGTVFALYLASMLLLGLKGIPSQLKIMKQPGTLVTDYVFRDGLDATLFNMGLVGLIGMAYIWLVGGHFNGPTLGGVLTMAGFAAFGKNPKNVWPVMAGVFLAAWFTSKSPADPVILTAALFGTTLAPLAGGFGIITGILAGFVHLSVVLHVGAFHAGMNLYNNGFAGGLTATLFICTIRWLHLHRQSE